MTMSENKQQQEGISVQKQAERPSDFSSELQKLVKFGGFNALESSIDGIASMNPERKARRKMFLTDPERAKERKELIKRLEMWLNMLKEGKSISEMIDICKEKSNLVADLLKKNQMKAIEEIKPLETSYRTVMLIPEGSSIVTLPPAPDGRLPLRHRSNGINVSSGSLSGWLV